MNKPLTFTAMLLFILTSLGAQAPTPASNSAAKVAVAPKAVSLTPAESFEMLNALNEDEKLFPESYMMPLSKYKNLKAENCFGVRLANGKRLAGESGGKSYGLRGHTIGEGGKEEDVFVVIGALYSEFPFSINNHSLPAGPYLVQSHKDALELVGNAEEGTRYDMNRRKDVPLSKEEKLPLKAALADELLAEKAEDVPRFTLGIDKGSIVLSHEGNSWKVVPR